MMLHGWLATHGVSWVDIRPGIFKQNSTSGALDLLDASRLSIRCIEIPHVTATMYTVIWHSCFNMICFEHWQKKCFLASDT